MKSGPILAVAIICMFGSAGGAIAKPLIVLTDTGAVQGAVSDGVKSWKGIPFAQPPIGTNRWRAPQPIARWAGVRDATQYGHDCMQLPFPSDAAPLGTEPSEDCLVLNVWAPQRARKGSKLPVVAWIYGGGFVNGGSSPPTYSGENIARKGVVFVSFNYRLGRFGTFLLPQLAAEDPKNLGEGNFALMDQLAALRWIRRNVGRFGGDPRRVTLIGESAGGMSVNVMLTSPLARGLFQRAVVMSGGNGHTSGAAGRAEVERASIAFSELKGFSQNDPDALEKLRALPAEQIVDGLNLATLDEVRTGARPYSGPFSDGKLAVDPAQAIARGQFAHIPVIIGATSNDIGGPTGYMAAGAHSLAKAISAQGVPTFEYRFSYVASSLGKTGADHASDIPFFFDTQDVKYGDQTTARDRRMGETISAYLINFAKTGNPNGSGLPVWRRHTRAKDSIMNFAADGAAEPGEDPLGKKLDEAITR